MESKTKNVQEPKVIELERLYIYPNDMRPGETMRRYIQDVTGVTVEADGHHTVHTLKGDEYVGTGWLRIMHKVPQEEGNAA